MTNIKKLLKIKFIFGVISFLITFSILNHNFVKAQTVGQCQAFIEDMNPECVSFNAVVVDQNGNILDSVEAGSEARIRFTFEAREADTIQIVSSEGFNKSFSIDPTNTTLQNIEETITIPQNDFSFEATVEHLTVNNSNLCTNQPNITVVITQRETLSTSGACAVNFSSATPTENNGATDLTYDDLVNNPSTYCQTGVPGNFGVKYDNDNNVTKWSWDCVVMP
jgi:hypothetical protein